MRKNAAQGGTGRTGGCLLPVLVAQIMVCVYVVGLFENVFQQETDSVRRLPVQFLCAGIPQNLADIGVDLVDFLVEPKPDPAGSFHDLALCNELAEIGGDRQAGQFPIAFQPLKLFLCHPDRDALLLSRSFPLGSGFLRLWRMGEPLLPDLVCCLGNVLQTVECLLEPLCRAISAVEGTSHGVDLPPL